MNQTLRNMAANRILPNEVEIPMNVITDETSDDLLDAYANEISDYLSDTYAYAVKGFLIKKRA